jgi:hypothetical protein
VVSLLDGGTGSLITSKSVPQANPDDDLEVVQSGDQSGSGAYVLDHTTGKIVHVDGATLTPGSAQLFTPPGDAKHHMQVAANANGTWIIEQSGAFVQEVDPDALTPIGSSHPLVQGASTPVVLPDGSLWVSAAAGRVESFANGLPKTVTTPEGSACAGLGSCTLVGSDGLPVLVDPSKGDLTVLNPRDGLAQHRYVFDVSEPAALPSGAGDSRYVAAVDPKVAALQVFDLADRRQGGSTSLSVDSSSAPLGPAVVKGNLMFVPEYGSGAVVVVEVVHGDQPTVLGRVPIGLHDHFALISHNHHVWFDDPDGDLAGVITESFNAVAVSKLTGKSSVVGHLTPINQPLTTLPPPSSGPGSTVTSPGGGTSVTSGRTNSSSPGGSNSSNQSTPTTTTTTTTTTIPGATTTTTTTTTTTSTTTTTTTLPPGRHVTPSFTWSPGSPQALQQVTFTDISNAPPHSDSWVFPGASSVNPGAANARTEQVIWKNVGTFPVRLVITNGGVAYPVTLNVHVGPLQGSFFAVVNSDGTLARGSPGLNLTVQHPSKGVYQVVFPTSVAGCATVANLGYAGSSEVFTHVTADTALATGNTVIVNVVDPGPLPPNTYTPALVDDSFHLYVDCGSALLANVQPGGSIRNSSPGVTSVHGGGAGQYSVSFGRDISQCAPEATVNIATSSGSPIPVQGYLALEANHTTVDVSIDNSPNGPAPQAVDDPFSLIVTCNGAYHIFASNTASRFTGYITFTVPGANTCAITGNWYNSTGSTPQTQGYVSTWASDPNTAGIQTKNGGYGVQTGYGVDIVVTC